MYDSSWLRALWPLFLPHPTYSQRSVPQDILTLRQDLWPCTWMPRSRSRSHTAVAGCTRSLNCNRSGCKLYKQKIQTQTKSSLNSTCPQPDPQNALGHLDVTAQEGIRAGRDSRLPQRWSFLSLAKSTKMQSHEHIGVLEGSGGTNFTPAWFADTVRSS